MKVSRDLLSKLRTNSSMQPSEKAQEPSPVHFEVPFFINPERTSLYKLRVRNLFIFIKNKKPVYHNLKQFQLLYITIVDRFNQKHKFTDCTLTHIINNSDNNIERINNKSKQLLFDNNELEY